MANDTNVTIIGNLTANPEISKGVHTPVVNFTVASTPSNWERESNSFVDKETIFMRCSVWREQAENLANSLHSGDRVIACGKLRSNSYEKNGEKRVSLQLEIDEVGPSLRYATAVVTKRAAGSGGSWNKNKNSTPSNKASDTNGWQDDSASNDEPPF